ncbi:Hypothetical protein CAP_3255 [Chondromyces apiculatus DSM 436]|uniref:Uncharacterized protein n=2 Tax=Chondromyces apiculatus TaxID=51 RepID=A0A017T7U1_9BACT|nr:Hypothetical protein CAP_3255 [Chondromyces apiculatus DSM 436]
MPEVLSTLSSLPGALRSDAAAAPPGDALQKRCEPAIDSGRDGIFLEERGFGGAPRPP